MQFSWLDLVGPFYLMLNMNGLLHDGFKVSDTVSEATFGAPN